MCLNVSIQFAALSWKIPTFSLIHFHLKHSANKTVINKLWAFILRLLLFQKLQNNWKDAIFFLQRKRNIPITYIYASFMFTDFYLWHTVNQIYLFCFHESFKYPLSCSFIFILVQHLLQLQLWLFPSRHHIPCFYIFGIEDEGPICIFCRKGLSDLWKNTKIQKGPTVRVLGPNCFYDWEKKPNWLP